MRKIAVIGAFGDETPTSSGQIIRTNITYDEFVKKYGEKRVIKVNTTNTEKNRIKFVLQLFSSLVVCDYFFIIVSENGMRTLYPVLDFASRRLHKTVLNSIVGGTVLPILKAYPKCVEAMKSFEVNFVQLPSMVKEMAVAGIENTEILPNSKPLEMTSIDDYHKEKNIFRFCTFSRISKEKGIEDAIEAIKGINTEHNEIIAFLDIYGQPDKNYIKIFDEMQKQFPSYIKYKGVVPFNETVDYLKNYYALIFPTTFDGEGFPGTLVDAFFSGLPVIATNWKHNAEVLSDKKTGLLYSVSEDNGLRKRIKYAIQNPQVLLEMRYNCLEEAKKYSLASVMNIIMKYIKK